MSRLRGVHLDGPLPEDWRDLAPPLDLPVTCGGSEHIVRWDRGEVTLLNHSASNRVVVALGAPDPPCHSIARAWQEGHAEPFWDDRRGKVAPIYSVAVGMVHEFVARCDRNAFTERLVEQALYDWMVGVGAIAEGEPAAIEVVIRSTSPWRKAAEPTGMGRRSVGITGSFGPDMATRSVVHVSDNWYEDVRNFGLVVAGRLNLGHNGRHLVLADVRPDSEDPHLHWILGKAYETIGRAESGAPFTLPPKPSRPPMPSRPRVGFLWGDEEHGAGRVNPRDEALASPDCWLEGERDARGWTADNSVYQSSLGAGNGGTLPFDELRVRFPALDHYVSASKDEYAIRNIWNKVPFGDLMAFCADHGVNFVDCCFEVGTSIEMGGSRDAWTSASA